MGLTVTEKEHWKSRIERKISKKVETLKRSDPELLQSLKKQAHEQALSRLGIVEAYGEVQELKRDIRDQEKLLETKRSALHAKLTGESESYSYATKGEIKRVILRYQEEEEERLMGDSPLGTEILKLEEERDNLLDTVWLATSSKQVRDLWLKVAELLGDESTEIQREIFAGSQSDD